MFKNKENQTNLKVFFSYMIIAYIFSIVCRIIWLYQFKGTDAFMWNNQFMINTNDGYFFAEGARDILYFGKYNSQALSQVTAFLAKTLPFSFETILLWLPAFLGGLLVVPLLLIGKSLKEPTAGFIAALIGSIAWSYYNRTMIGYYDTDMLNIVLPMFVLWSIIHSIVSQKNRYLVVMVIFLILSQWWYPKNVSLNTAMIFMAFVYNIIFDRKNTFNFKLLSFAFIGLSFIPVILKITLVIVLFLLFHYKNDLIKKYIFYILGLSVVIYIFSGAFNTIWSSLNLYVINRLFAEDINNLHFFSVITTVREAGAIPFETFANRISGHVFTFILATIGLVVMIIRFPVLIVSLPMIAMGYMAYKAGLRFTVYAVPLYSLGIGYLFVFIASFFSKSFKSEIKGLYFKLTVLTFSTVAILYPNIMHIVNYKVPTVFNKQEVEVLDKLKNIASRDDYVISWWDYGFPIRYYSDVNTFVDGGVHNGDVNYPVSLALTNNQIMAANMTRTNVEYILKNSRLDNFKLNLENIFKDYNFSSINQFLMNLNNKEFKLPSKTTDVFFYLPDRMMGIFPTVAVFSNIDLSTGREYPRNFFYQTGSFKDVGNAISLGNNINIQKQGGKIQIGQQTLNINSFIVTAYDNKGKLQVNTQTIDSSSPIYVIFMKSYNRFLVLDKKMFESTYIQLYVLENYDKDLYEPVILSPYAKVFKLKV